jgi:hypothetical protein
MTSTFDRQMEPCARNGHSVRPPPAAKGNSSPRIPRAICDKSAPDRMLEHETQAAFLKALIGLEDGEASLELQDSLAKAERESKWIRHVMFLMVTLFSLSLAGLGYCAVLLPEIFFNPTHLVTKSLTVLGLASLISQLELFGYLLWHRLAVNRLHKECRRRVLLLVESQLKASLRRSQSVDTSQEPGSTSVGAAYSRQEDPRRNDQDQRAAPVPN